MKYVCLKCGYVYDPKKGESRKNVQPGTEFASLPGDWVCPDCGAEKGRFAREG